jgi:hypothetical protein
VDPVPDPLLLRKILATLGIEPGTPVLVSRNSDQPKEKDCYRELVTIERIILKEY